MAALVTQLTQTIQQGSYGDVAPLLDAAELEVGSVVDEYTHDAYHSLAAFVVCCD